jgi:hypothetical protein
MNNNSLTDVGIIETKDKAVKKTKKNERKKPKLL